MSTNLWRFKVRAPPIANAVVNHPVLFHTILPSKDLPSGGKILSADNHHCSKKCKLAN